MNSNKRPLRHLGNGMFHFDEGVLPTEVHSRKGKDVLERGTLLRSRPRSFRGGEVNSFDALRRDSNNSAHTTLTKSRGKKRGFFYSRLRDPHLRALTYFVSYRRRSKRCLCTGLPVPERPKRPNMSNSGLKNGQHKKISTKGQI